MGGRGVRLLEGYDREFGVIVAGTLDPAVAVPMIRASEIEQIETEYGKRVPISNEDRAYIEERITESSVIPTWYRIVPAKEDNPEGWAWQLWPASKGARGAFKCVEWRR